MIPVVGFVVGSLVDVVVSAVVVEDNTVTVVGSLIDVVVSIEHTTPKLRKICTHAFCTCVNLSKLSRKWVECRCVAALIRQTRRRVCLQFCGNTRGGFLSIRRIVLHILNS